ncbi:MAG TPA: hypothetical protein VFZ00_13685 [Solirubrobacter sp.]|nr:hypothetical protein [Solirubrobacter sp.]
MICARVGDQVTDTALEALATPTDHRFQVDLLPGARIANGAGTAHRLTDFRPGQTVVIQVPEHTPQADATTVGDSGPVLATGVVELILGTRASIRDRAGD